MRQQRHGIGCGTMIVAAIILGFALTYWRVAIPLVIAAAIIALILYLDRRHKRTARADQLGRGIAAWWKLPVEKFEVEIVHLLRSRGWRKVDWVGDEGGADIMGVDEAGRRTVVLARHLYPTAEIGRSVIELAVACIHPYQADRALIITTGLFSDTARRLAGAADVELVTGAGLAAWSGA